MSWNRWLWWPRCRAIFYSRSSSAAFPCSDDCSEEITCPELRRLKVHGTRQIDWLHAKLAENAKNTSSAPSVMRSLCTVAFWLLETANIWIYILYCRSDYIKYLFFFFIYEKNLKVFIKKMTLWLLIQKYAKPEDITCQFQIGMREQNILWL